MSRRERVRDDTGAALVIALLFVTVVGLVSGVLLSFTDASIRATEQLRVQATQTYTADGAAQVAINAIRQSTLTNASSSDSATVASACVSAAPGAFPMSVPPISDGSTTSALVTCERSPERKPDPGAAAPAVINALNTPGHALLTLGTSGSEYGISQSANSSGTTLEVKGKIASNSTIRVASGTLRSDTSVIAYGSCTGSGSLSAPAGSCSSGQTQGWPPYTPPTVPAAQNVPTCPSTGGLVTFNPGVYTNATALSACDRTTTTMHFTPGVYYFNFPSSAAIWTMNSGSMVAGTPSSDYNIATTNPAGYMPGSCVSPLEPTTDQYTPPAANLGVQFVFAGPSQWVVGGSAKVEVCGSYSAGSPSIAIAGLQVANGTMPAQNGCVIAPAGCAMISTTTASSDNSRLFVQGTLYAHKALLKLNAVDVSNRENYMYFYAGVVARSVTVVLNGTMPSSLGKVIGLPSATAVPPPPVPNNLPEVVVLLKVYVCPGEATCTEAKGRLRLRTEVGISNPTTGTVAAGPRAVEIYSWAVQR